MSSKRMTSPTLLPMGNSQPPGRVGASEGTAFRPEVMWQRPRPMHHRAKLTDDDVRHILELRAARVPCLDLATRFGVSVHTVKSISAGRRRT